MLVSTFLAILGGTILPMLLLSMKDLHDRMVDLGLEANNPFTCGEVNQDKGKPVPIQPVISAGASLLRSINIPTNATWNQTKNKTGHENVLEGVPIETLMELAANMSMLQNFIPIQFSHYSLDVLNKVKDKLLIVTTEICFRMSVLAVIQVAIMYAITTLSTMAAAKQGYRIRSAFMTSLLRQEVAWFDAQQDENFADRLLRSLDCIQDGIGDKVVLSILNMMNSLAVLGTAFSMSWIVTIVILSSAPLICIATILLGRCHIFYTRKQMRAYSKAGTVAEEALSGIKTVLAYGAEQKELTRYKRGLTESKRIVVRQACCLGFGYGLIWFLSFFSFALAIWYGCRKVVIERCQPNGIQTSNVLGVILCVMNGAVSISQAAANLESFSAARAAAVKIFHIIDRVPIIDSTSPKGHKPVNTEGTIEFKNVFFHYPTRTGIPVLQDLNLTIHSGETVAVVGTSGCGKSTIIQLLQRFYDPVQGEIYLDGISLKDLNLGWLRSQIGAVGQEPVLFEMSIGENIALGQPGVTFGALVQASICAGAHDFIMKLPQKYDTLVGEKGTQLSGGQKQRVAIARALVKNPKILLLDEATSALDSVSEAGVKEALEMSKKGRTTLVIAHRLSTIKNADRIVFLKDGQVAEVGTHDELLAKRDHYYRLVACQNYGAQVILENNKRLSVSSDDDIFYQDGRRTQQKLVFKQAEHQLDIDSVPALSKKMEHDAVCRRKSSLCLESPRASQSWHLPFELCSSEWHLLFLGAIASVLVGMSIPLFAIIYTKSISMLQLPKDEAFRHINDKAVLLLIIGITSAVSAFVQTLTFDLAGERMTRRIRRKMFRAMLDQDVSWFDDPKNFSGALCARLTKDASSVQEASAGLIRSAVQAVSSLVTCMYMELSASLALTVVAAAFVPVVVLSTQVHKAAFGGVHKRNNHAEERSSQTAVEAIRSIRTVASLHLEITFVSKFVDYLRKQYSDMKRTCHLNGLMYGLSRGTMPFTCATCIYYGVRLIIDGKLTYELLYQMIQAILISMEILTQTLASSPNYGKSWESSERIVQLLSNRQKRRTLGPKDRKKVMNAVLQGDIEFRNVHFSYPLRQEVKVLKGLDLKVKAGHTLALLGTSGCGKSTCIAILQGFYECQQGEVLIDGVNIKEYHLGWLRSKMGLVSQEPVLFGVSLAENIGYGSKTCAVNSHQIISAAKTANIHNFLRDLPLGYQTRAGGRESWLSGGEKQRIAIARALLRNPKILLLDEATSALDSEAEKVVQKALENARQGRTCVVIAHRLSTVQNADQIVIIHEGAAVEQGTHQELMAKKGFYYKMQRMQNSTNCDV